MAHLGKTSTKGLDGIHVAAQHKNRRAVRPASGGGLEEG
jgi:hypothetical protein